MGSTRRGRRPGGHPAKVAARRERDAARRGTGPSGLGSIARRIVREVADLTSAFDAELWASQLLGTFWREVSALPPDDEEAGAMLMLGGPLVDALAKLGGQGARTALRVIAAVDDTELGMYAGRLAERMEADPRDAAPSWLGDVGLAEVTGAAVMRDDVFDDGCTVFLEARHASGEIHAIGVLIDHNFGGMARDMLLAESIDRVAEVISARPSPDGDLILERITPGAAAGRIDAAMELTEMTLDPPVDEDYAPLRALALLLVDEVPHYGRPTAEEPMSQDERDQLRDEFLASPEGHGFAPDGDEAYVATLAISFCADYVDGRPLRWSPSVVELFMADWIPRKVLTDEALLERLPSALDAWVRFAGRKAGTPGWAIAKTQEAIPRWRRDGRALRRRLERSQPGAVARRQRAYRCAVPMAVSNRSMRSRS